MALSLLSALAMGGCAAATGTGSESARSSETEARSEEGNIVAIPADDPGIAAAQREAQRQWPQFVASFRTGTARSDYGVKVGMPTADGSREHLWIAVTAIQGNTVIGTIANDPIEDIGYVFGDIVRVRRAQVEDWLITQGSEIVAGGFSLDVVASAQD